LLTTQTKRNSRKGPLKKGKKTEARKDAGEPGTRMGWSDI